MSFLQLPKSLFFPLCKLITAMVITTFAAPITLNAQTKTETQAVKTLFGAGLATYNGAQFHAQLAVDTAFLASRLAGAYVLTGTLTQYVPGAETFTYTPEPRDRLVVKFVNSETIVLRFKDFRGDYSRGSNNFLLRDHALHFTTEKVGVWQLELGSKQLNGQREGAMAGRADFEKVHYAVNLRFMGTVSYEGDSSGSELRSNIAMTGSIQSKAGNLTVDESHLGNVITSKSSTGRTTVATSSERHVRNGMDVGGDRYRAVDVKMLKVFKDGKPSDPDFWLRTTGVVEKNQQSISTIRAGYELPYAKIIAIFPGGGVELERWLIDTLSR